MALLVPIAQPIGIDALAVCTLPLPRLAPMLGCLQIQSAPMPSTVTWRMQDYLLRAVILIRAIMAVLPSITATRSIDALAMCTHPLSWLAVMW